MSLNRKHEGDEAVLIADLNATFPRADAKSLRIWSGNTTNFGACICGEAEIEDGFEIGPYIAPDDEAYDGYIHKAFAAWVEARGWYVEVYEPGTLWVVPLPTIPAALDNLTTAWFPLPCHPDDGSLPF
jgi:hypothetical protein